jgi:hypothetical protein
MYNSIQIADVEIDRIHTRRLPWIIWSILHEKKAERASSLMRQPLEGHVQIHLFIDI